jgi:hypothetical protein
VADLTGRCASLTSEINQLEQEIAERVTTLLTIVGCVSLTAAKILGEIAGVDRFRSKDAYARYAGTAPLRVWTGTANGTASTESATGSSTRPCTASPSPQAHYHPRLGNCSNADAQPATAPRSRCASSSADSATSSIKHFGRT